jgi:radical SAM superfamily enzyme YgiQ (UPF0313 family)
LPSPYLLGYLEPGQILMVEISRWCPYSCGFCLPFFKKLFEKVIEWPGGGSLSGS